MTTLHILASPTNAVNLSNRTDPFSVLAYKFIDHMMSYGWNCIHYGITGADVKCQTVICLDTLKAASTNFVSEYNNNAGLEISKRKKPGDIIVCFYGTDNKAAADQNPDLIVVEPSVGYDVGAVFAPYRIFTSYAHMHMFYGSRNMLMNPSWFDAVIPNAISSTEFEFNDKKEDYFLIFGRVIESKGINIAIQITEHLNKKLIIAGPGSLDYLGYNKIPDHVTMAGVCDADQRNNLMKNAKAVLGPTHYVEPFGNMIVEGYMCGTPAITTDWGGFTETVIHGVTGYRCREFRDFVYAIENIDKIDPETCYKFAKDNFDDSIVHKKINDYFIKLQSRNFYRT